MRCDSEFGQQPQETSSHDGQHLPKHQRTHFMGHHCGPFLNSGQRANRSNGTPDSSDEVDKAHIEQTPLFRLDFTYGILAIRN